MVKLIILGLGLIFIPTIFSFAKAQVFPFDINFFKIQIFSKFRVFLNSDFFQNSGFFFQNSEVFQNPGFFFKLRFFSELRFFFKIQFKQCACHTPVYHDCWLKENEQNSVDDQNGFICFLFHFVPFTWNEHNASVHSCDIRELWP